MRVLLFSGGVESTALAYMLRPDVLFTIDYGQAPAQGELRAATFIARELGLNHETLSVDCSPLGAGDMAGRPIASHSRVSEAWPFRNQLLVTLAAMKFAGEGLKDILIGTVVSDRVHADGSPEFVERLDMLIKCELPQTSVTAPALNMSTLELVKRSQVPMDILGWSFSCHRSTVACGQCRGCNKTIDLWEALERS
ncbi:7-cyano-7-deazaguanine synthase [Celeribacter indicus]|nr:7-cyano-7-deazaguanine synthase [Celeribacter indicus]SDX48062.1 7-cyano-7-deazaguanine synthase [Celeribacter indicus]